MPAPKKPESVAHVAAIFGRLNKLFQEAPDGSWLTSKRLDLRPATFGGTVLRRLVAEKLLERARVPGFANQFQYRPSHGGWALLASIDRIPSADLYARYGTPRYQPAAGRCSVCSGAVKDRMVSATRCWGCEQKAKRVEAGVDHLPRTEAYMATIPQGRQVLERRRIRLARAARRALEKYAALNTTAAHAAKVSGALKGGWPGGWAPEQAAAAPVVSAQLPAGSRFELIPEYRDVNPSAGDSAVQAHRREMSNNEVEALRAVANLAVSVSKLAARVEALEAKVGRGNGVDRAGGSLRAMLVELVREELRGEVGQGPGHGNGRG